jgi:nitroimidazol reductase NimA-like FMN-containing flavoprotein (pyridoxamine 5'-phosphate oxidase superfamily)
VDSTTTPLTDEFAANAADRFTLTERTKLRRIPARGSHERPTVYAILDEGFICHVGFVVDGRPYVIPTGYARVEDRLYIHGSAASRMLRALEGGIETCVNVTLIDGLVLARSAFHHSINYRSVVIFGTASLVRDEAEKFEALRALTEHFVPGRWDEVRKPNELEMKQTMVLALPIVEASAKVRTGPPLDDGPDYDWPVWAGEVPLWMAAGSPVDDGRLVQGIGVPDYALSYKRLGTGIKGVGQEI